MRAIGKKPLVGVATVALALAITACGGDGNGGDAAETPEELASCLEEKGYSAEVVPEPAEGEPLKIVGSIGAVRVRVGENNGVSARFFDEPEQAEDFAESTASFLEGAGGGGGTEVVAETVELSNARSGADQELEAFRTCLEG